MASVKGGDKFAQTLAAMSRDVAKAESVDIGFLPDKTYPDGTPVALVAAVNEFGNQSYPPKGTPPRPFFRGMIARESPHWGRDISELMKLNGYDTLTVLTKMGIKISEELQQSINDFVGIPLKQATIDAKGFDKQLIDTGVMVKSVDFVVKTK